MRKIKIPSHNTQLYRNCIVGRGLTGLALAYLLYTNKTYKHKTCILDISSAPANNKTFAKNKFYVSTGFIQHKSYKLIKKFFANSALITNTIQSFNFIGSKKIINVQFKKPIGYILNLESFINNLYSYVKNNPYISFIHNAYITDIEKLKQPAHRKFKLTLNHTLNNNAQQNLKQRNSNPTHLHITNLIIADGTISNTSKLLRQKGFKLNINHKFSQGAEAMIKIHDPRSITTEKTLNILQQSIYFGISYEFAGYGFWIAPYQQNIIKIGYSIDQRTLLRRKYNLNNLLDLAIHKSLQVLKIPQNSITILHKGFKLIPLVTATQLYNITPYKHIWQIGDAGGFVGPLLLDGIYPGLNSVIDTYKEIISQNTSLNNEYTQNTKKQTMLWQPKISIPGNSIYTHKLLTYITTSAIIKEFYNLIFIARPITKIATIILEKIIKKALHILMKIKKEGI